MSKDNCEFISNIVSVPFNDYSGVSSREKLVVYAIKYLSDNNIPATFDYVCMTAYKLFPEEFKLSDEFPDQADIAGLNRTLMHLRPSERNLASGKPNTAYVLNENGIALAKQVEEGIIKKIFVKTESVSNHDKVISRKNDELYLSIIKSPIYLLYIENNIYSLDIIWRLFKTAPFSNMETTLEKIKTIKEIALSKNDSSCNNLCKMMEQDLKDLINKKRVLEKGVKR